MHDYVPFQVGGYVLAGGKSSRMGKDKALMQLAGKPLIRHAVTKLSRICSDVHILSSNHELAPFAPLVPDLHPDCGPIGGIEAALLRSTYEWNAFLAVDMPFLPSAYLWGWMSEWMRTEDDGARIRMFTADDRPQPGFCLLHRDVAPFFFDAIKRGELKLMSVFETAGRELALRRGFPPEAGLWSVPATGSGTMPGKIRLPEWLYVSDAQRAAERLWFSNLNTPWDFAEAEAHLDALDA
jgi:molybdenum cofactor guanylyltransferase